MLDMGFEPQIRKIIREIPPQRQVPLEGRTRGCGVQEGRGGGSGSAHDHSIKT